MYNGISFDEKINEFAIMGFGAIREANAYDVNVWNHEGFIPLYDQTKDDVKIQ